MARKLFRSVLWVEGIALTIILSVSCSPNIDSNEYSIKNDEVESLRNDSQKLSKKLYAELENKRIVTKRNGNMLNNLTCEYFDDSKCEDADKEKCHRNITCQEENEYCFTSWKLSSSKDQSQASQNSILSKNLSFSGGEVKSMGCMQVWKVDECQRNCVHADKKIQKHGHLYCCCTGKIHLKLTDKR